MLVALHWGMEKFRAKKHSVLFSLFRLGKKRIIFQCHFMVKDAHDTACSPCACLWRCFLMRNNSRTGLVTDARKQECHVNLCSRTAGPAEGCVGSGGLFRNLALIARLQGLNCHFSRKKNTHTARTLPKKKTPLILKCF